MSHCFDLNTVLKMDSVCEALPVLFAFQNEYMKDDFFIKIETWHKPDTGTTENVSVNTQFISTFT